MTKRRFSCEFFGETNQGRVRANNEDAYICQNIWDESHILCAAIDGLGGYEGGEIAAELARTTITKHLEDFASEKIGDLLKAALIDANNSIIRQREARPKVSQMGCVASVGIVDLTNGVISIAHVGDSRIYQFANGELKKLTHDHSLVGYREETGELSEEAAMRHPRRNVIDRFLGQQHLDYDAENYIEISAWPITGDTQYLFCSDGLTDLVTSAQISSILSSETPVEAKTQSLISAANDAGGKDNITVVLADVKVEGESAPVENTETAPSEAAAVSTPTSFRKGFLPGLLVGLILGAAAMFIYYEISADSVEMPSSSPAGAQQSALQENMELRHKIKLLEDSIAKISSAKESDVDSVNPSDLPGNNTDKQN